jgi:hypothetical protein
VDSSTNLEEVARPSSPIQGTQSSSVENPRARCKQQRAATAIGEDDDFNKDFQRLVDYVVG